MRKGKGAQASEVSAMHRTLSRLSEDIAAARSMGNVEQAEILSQAWRVVRAVIEDSRAAHWKADKGVTTK